MKLAFLGTSGAMPTLERNLSSAALILNNGEMIIFDAGEDLQKRMRQAQLKFNASTTILISHLHGDHVIGLPGLLFTFNLNNRTKSITLIGPMGIAAYILTQSKIIGLKSDSYQLEVVEIPVEKNWNELQKKGDDLPPTLNYYANIFSDNIICESIPLKNNVLKETKGCKIEAYRLYHTAPNYGYKIIEHPRRGKFDPERAIECGVPRGHLWEKMHRGHSVTLKNGTIVDPLKEKIVSLPIPGKTFFYTGDTTYFDKLIDFTSNVDFLICECTFEQIHHENALERKHMTSTMAAKLAKESGAKNLILTHFSNRYKDTIQIEKEAKEIFPEVICSEDLMTINIKYNDPISILKTKNLLK